MASRFFGFIFCFVADLLSGIEHPASREFLMEMAGYY
jgi:hypothetical protein